MGPRRPAVGLNQLVSVRDDQGARMLAVQPVQSVLLTGMGGCLVEQVVVRLAFDHAAAREPEREVVACNSPHATGVYPGRHRRNQGDEARGYNLCRCAR